MKLTFERDIPEFNGKTWRERIALRQKAINLDWRIRLRTVLIGPFIYLPLLVVLIELAKHHIVPSLTWVLILYSVIGISIVFLLRALWINPLIKNALEDPRAQ